MKKRILFLTSNIGGGHMSATKALIEAFNKYNEGEDKYEYQVVDVISLLGPSLDKVISKMHEVSVNHAKITYKTFFALTDKSNIANLFDKYGYHLIRQHLKPIVDSKPDLIISSFPFLTYSVSRYLGKQNDNIILTSIITDTGEVHSAWISDHVDYFFVPNAETGFYLSERGINLEKIKTFGLPLRQEFYQNYDKSLTKNNLGIPSESSVVLVLNGAWGTNSKLIDRLFSIDKENEGISIVVVCGKNEKLKNKIDGINFKNMVMSLGFVNNVAELINCADVVVTKAGGASIMESVKMKKPIIVSEVLPGQEKYNARFIEYMGFGYIETDIENIGKRLKFVLKTDDYKRIISNYSQYNLDDFSGKNIVDFLSKKLK